MRPRAFLFNQQVRHLVAWGAAHQVHVFASPGAAHASLHRWATAADHNRRALAAVPASSPAPCFVRLSRLLLAPSTGGGSSGLGGGGSGCSLARGSALGAPATPEGEPGDWVRALLASLRSFGNRGKYATGSPPSPPTPPPSVDARLWHGVWRGRGVRGLANYDAIVLCHDQARAPASFERGDPGALAVAEKDDAPWAEAVLLELPRALRASGWAKVVHVFEADLHALKDGGDNEHK